MKKDFTHPLQNSNDMERLNDNEVREVARMQELITKYENVIQSLYAITLSGVHITMIKTTDTALDREINHLWRWVTSRKDSESAKKEKAPIV